MVREKISVDAIGNVISSETPGGNPMFNNAVKSAVDRWKFSPAMDASGARCVDTEIPMVIGPLTLIARMRVADPSPRERICEARVWRTTIGKIN
jgi:hypothetical protein